MTHRLENEHITRLKDLLFVIEECRGYPRLKAMHDAAMAEVEALSQTFEPGYEEPEAAAEAHIEEETDE